jgi:hypothetical protein
VPCYYRAGDRCAGSVEPGLSPDAVWRTHGRDSAAAPKRPLRWPKVASGGRVRE